MAAARGGGAPGDLSFNGGPGSSSVWLHMGALGPRRVVFGPEGEALAPPAKLADNEHSWLDLTDLVFIDPVSTGFSRANEGESPSQFHGLNEDASSVADFIRLWISRSGRWLSPKYLVGESYGTTRAAALSAELQDRLGIYLNGISMVSMVLNFQTLSFDLGNDTAYWLFLPSYTATAFHHGKLRAPLSEDFERAVQSARDFAVREYLPALARGDTLTEAERDALASRLAEFMGVSAEFVKQRRLRVSVPAFTKELLRDQSRTVGRLDSRYKGIDRFDATDEYEYDPSYAAILGPYTAALNAYVREELAWTTDVNYEILTGRVRPWKYPDGRFVDVSETLRASMSKNPALRVWVANGYFDLATPFFAAEHTVARMGLDPALRGNVTMTYYKSGHMMYVRRETLRSSSRTRRSFTRMASSQWGVASGEWPVGSGQWGIGRRSEPTHPNAECLLLQPRHELRARADLGAGGRERVAEGFKAPAEVRGEERLGDGEEGHVVLGAGKAVALVGEDDVGHGQVLLLHDLDDLIALGDLHARVVRAVADQQRTLDLLHVRDGRARPQEAPAFGRERVATRACHMPISGFQYGGMVLSSVTRFETPTMLRPRRRCRV